MNNSVAASPCHLVTLSLVRYTGLTIIVLAFVALATLYSVVTPLGEGPDEPGHARYMFFLAREGRLPVQQKKNVADQRIR